MKVKFWYHSNEKKNEVKEQAEMCAYFWANHSMNGNERIKQVVLKQLNINKIVDSNDIS